MSIEWHEAIANEDTSCGLCCRTIRQGWTCCENTTDFDGPDWFHPECLAVTESWTSEQWYDYWYGCLDLDAIGWPTYDEQGNVVAKESVSQTPGADSMNIEPAPVVTREHQDRAAEIVEQMALKARDCWRGVYAMENELWQRLQQLRRMRDDVRMGDAITIAKVLREAADPPCVSCGSPRSQGCEDPTACGVATVPFSQHCDATRDCNDYVCVQDVRSLIPPERWPELERLHMLEVHECGRCNGHGKYPGRTRSCPECGGTGKQIIAGGVG